MLQKEFFNEVLTLEGIPDSIKEFAKDALKKIENKPPGKKTIENQEVRKQLLELLGDGEKVFAREIAAKADISRQKASSLLALLFKEGKVKRDAVKDGKSIGFQYYL